MFSLFLNHIKSVLNDDPTLIKIAEEKTRQQSNDLLWFDLRYGRITASKLYEVARCKTDGSLVNQILGISKKYDNIFMKRGRALEDDVLKSVSKKLKKNLRNVVY